MTGGRRRAERRGAVRAVCLVLALLAGTAAPVEAHPLHTTVTEITSDPARRVVRAVIRVFADDFGKALARPDRGGSSAPVAEQAALAYLQRAFVLTGRDGRVMPLRSCGTRRTGDLLWLCVETDAPTGLVGTRVRNSVLCELYDDQVNIVRTTAGGTASSLLFTRNATAKPLL